MKEPSRFVIRNEAHGVTPVAYGCMPRALSEDHALTSISSAVIHFGGHSAELG